MSHPNLLIVVPAYNESETLGSVLSSLIALKRDEWDILVVNDHSTDETSKVARQYVSRVIDLPINLGIGGCVQTGFQYALEHGYDSMMQFDGDGQHQAEEVERLLKRLHSEKADMLIGSRFKYALSYEGHHRSTRMRRVGIKVLSYLCFLLTGRLIKDPTSGFRLYSKKAIQLLAEQYPHNYPEPETIIFLNKNRMKIVETAAHMKERSGGSSSIEYQGFTYMINVMLGMIISSVRPRSRQFSV